MKLNRLQSARYLFIAASILFLPSVASTNAATDTPTDPVNIASGQWAGFFSSVAEAPLLAALVLLLLAVIVHRPKAP